MSEQVQEQEPKKRNILKKILFFFLLSLLLFYLYIRFFEPNTILVKEQAIVDQMLPSSFDGIKIVQISDILYGSTINEKNLDKIIKKVNSLNPDIVLFTGDLLNDSFQINEHDQSVLKEKLSKIEAKLKKYAVLGDNDYINKSVYLDIMNSAGFKVLENENDLFYYKGNDPILFIGTSSLLEQEMDIEESIKRDESIESYYKIWINHEPAIINELTNKSIFPNLIFTGHTLNGLINIPFTGYLLKQDGILSYTNSYYENNNTKMYISSGLGTYKYSVRLFNYPSISLYRLYKE